MAMAMDNGPKGNWAARQLRLLNDDSRELFPKTPADVKPTKYDSIYKIEYQEYPTEVFLDGLMPKGQQQERQTIRDVLFGQSPTSMFANWRIPNRIAGEVEEARIGDHVGLVQPEKIPTPRILRQSTLPTIPTAWREGPKPFTPKPRLSASDIRLSDNGPAFRRSKTTMDKPERQQQKAAWQQRLPEVDSRLLDKVLRLQDKENGSRHAVKGATVMPDARRTVERWLEGASEAERLVALQFFGSMAGGRLMGNEGGDDQRARLNDVISALQHPSNRVMTENGLSQRGGAYTAGNGHLKYVNLLDDDTRRQRWMHTTWHHLPNYRTNNPVANSSSHYVTPHKPPHRHFVIHPDWSPN